MEAERALQQAENAYKTRVDDAQCLLLKNGRRLGFGELDATNVDELTIRFQSEQELELSIQWGAVNIKKKIDGGEAKLRTISIPLEEQKGKHPFYLELVNGQGEVWIDWVYFSAKTSSLLSSK